MTNIKNLADIIFVESDKEKVTAEIITAYETISGRTLAQGDPIRLFLLAIANIVILLLNQINEVGKQNLLRYASGLNLDYKGLEMGVERSEATPAKTTIKITLSAAVSVPVSMPAGTRFSAGDNNFFALDSLIVIPSGEVIGYGEATCLTKGTAGNGYLPGQIKTLVDPVPYVGKIENLTTSDGGADIQSDDSYREDIQMATEKFSTAGPAGAYEYWTKRASTSIVDACVWSPSPGVVEVRPLLAGGEIPGKEMLDIVSGVLNDRNVRPLTDRVTVLAPELVTYNVNAVYYIDSVDVAQANKIKEAAAAEVENYLAWQKNKLGRDINPSELIGRLMSAGVKRVEVQEPTFTVLKQTQVAREQTVSVSLGGYENG